MPRTNICKSPSETEKQKERIKKAQDRYATDIAQTLFGKAYISHTSKRDLAAMTGVSAQTMYKRFNSPGDLTVNEIVEMCIILDLPVSAIFVGGRV